MQESEEGAARKTQARTLKSRSQSAPVVVPGHALRADRKPPATGVADGYLVGTAAVSAAVSAIAASQAAHNDAPRAAGAPPAAAAEDAAASTPRPASTPGYERRINKGTPLAKKESSSAAALQGLLQARAQSAKPKTQKAPITEGPGWA